MKRRWRVVLATFCVEALAVVAVLTYGALSLMAVVIIYWVDLAFVIVRAVTRQLLGGETTDVQLPKSLPQFRLLKHKRGTLDVSVYPLSVYPQSFPAVLFSLSILAVSAVTTAAVLAVSVPAQFWGDPMTPLVLTGGGIAAATKSWLVYTDHTDRGGTTTSHGAGFLATKRQMLVLLYALVVYLVAGITTTALADPDVERVALFAVLSVILLRVAYGIRASRPASNPSGSAGRVESKRSDDQLSATPAPRLTPDELPLETVEPVSWASPAAGFVNALTTGGVVDGQFSESGLLLRFYVMFVSILGTLAAVNGSSLFRSVIAGVIVLGVVFWLLSTVHMELAFGEIEYQFYETAIVAYDRRLMEPQWSVLYDNIETISVDRGLFSSPAWLDAGTVGLELSDDTAPPPDEHGRASILFVSDPEAVRNWVDARHRDVRESR